ncbi:hypothetical protein ACWAT4_26515 [Bradyrhizobium manausense]
MGIRSPNIPLGTTADEFLVNQIDGNNRSLRRVPRSQVLGAIDAIVAAGQLGGGVAFTSKAQADGQLAYQAFQLGLVAADSDPSKNGLYQKTGASGSGGWTRIADLPNEIIQFSITGGTADAIVATMAPQVPSTPGGKLYLIMPTANNTGAALTINGIVVKNSLGSTPAADTFVANVPVSMIWSGNHYQILTSVAVDTAGVVADAVAARDAASGYATAAASSASALGNQVHQYDTYALAKAASIPSGVQFIRTQAYSTTALSSGLQYRKQASNPALVNADLVEPAAFQSADGAWWLFDPQGPVTPEAFGAKGKGVQTDDDAPIIEKLSKALKAIGGGVIRPRIGSTYILGSLSTNGLSTMIVRSGVSVRGEGFGAVFKLKAGVNTASQFYHIFYNDDLTTGANDVIFDGFTIDFDGVNNTGGNAAALNIAIGMEKGDNISISKIKVINNPGSTGFKCGRGPANPPTVTDLRIYDCVFEKNGDAVNPGCTDHSSIWVTAANAVIFGNTMKDGAKLYGTGIEAHGNGVLVFGNSITDYSGGMNLANEVDNHSYQITMIGNTLKNVNYGITVFAKNPNDLLGSVIADNNITVDPATASVGIDAASVVDVGANGGAIAIRNNIITAPGLVPSSSSTYTGIRLGAMRSIKCTGNQIFNTQGPGIWRTGSCKAGSIIKIDDNIIENPGLGTLSSVSAATVGAGGSGGTNGTQTVTVVGGTGVAAQLSVTVAGGAITAILGVTNAGSYSVVPSSPAAVTGAGLSGATVNLTTIHPYSVGILVDTDANTPAIVSVRGNEVLGTCRYGIEGHLNASAGGVYGNDIVGATVQPVLWTGTGVTKGVTWTSGAPNGNFKTADGIVTQVQ